MANLLMHCGGREVTRDEIADAPTPERTKTWVPVAHNRLLELAQSTIEARLFLDDAFGFVFGNLLRDRAQSLRVNKYLA